MRWRSRCCWRAASTTRCAAGSSRRPTSWPSCRTTRRSSRSTTRRSRPTGARSWSWSTARGRAWRSGTGRSASRSRRRCGSASGWRRRSRPRTAPGILHRDIKPANVLTTDFGWPALTDFGIAATTGHGAGATVGMSIPWSPPELLGEHPTGDERSDVYSLAATIYSLLAGRTPFEIAGGQNTAQQLVARIERAPLPPTGRDDVPREPAGAARAGDGEAPGAPVRLRGGRRPRAPAGRGRPPAADHAARPHGRARRRARTGAPAGRRPDEDREDATRLRSIVTVAPSAPVGAGVAEPPPGADEPTRLRGVTYVAPEPTSRTTRTRSFVDARRGRWSAEPETRPARPVAHRWRASCRGWSCSPPSWRSVPRRCGSDDPTDDDPTATSDFTQDAAPTAHRRRRPVAVAGCRAPARRTGRCVFTWDNPEPAGGRPLRVGRPAGRRASPSSRWSTPPTVTVPADQATTRAGLHRGRDRARGPPRVGRARAGVHVMSWGSVRSRATTAAAVVTVPVLVLVLALLDQGFPLARLDLNDGGVWLTATSKLPARPLQRAGRGAQRRARRRRGARSTCCRTRATCCWSSRARSRWSTRRRSR